VRIEPLAQELPEGVGLLDRLGSGEGGHDAAVGLAQKTLRLVDRAIPGNFLQSPAPDTEQWVA
jgi:hypothetical protein